MATINWNSLLTIPMEQWHELGFPLDACSANSDGMVNSFIVTIGRRCWVGSRRHEFKDGRFTGHEWFEVNPLQRR